MADENDSSKIALDSLRLKAKALKELGGGLDEHNAAIAQNILHEDIGHFGKPHFSYDFTDETRDILIAHARQDAAHAVINTSVIMKSNANLLRTLRFLTLVVLLCTVAIIWTIWSN